MKSFSWVFFLKKADILVNLALMVDEPLFFPSERTIAYLTEMTYQCGTSLKC